MKCSLLSMLRSTDEEAVDELPGLKVAVRELDEVLLRDTGGRIKESGK